MPDGRLEIVGDELMTSIDYCDELRLLFDRKERHPRAHEIRIYKQSTHKSGFWHV